MSALGQFARCQRVRQWPRPRANAKACAPTPKPGSAAGVLHDSHRKYASHTTVGQRLVHATECEMASTCPAVCGSSTKDNMECPESDDLHWWIERARQPPRRFVSRRHRQCLEQGKPWPVAPMRLVGRTTPATERTTYPMGGSHQDEHVEEETGEFAMIGAYTGHVRRHGQDNDVSSGNDWRDADWRRFIEDQIDFRFTHIGVAQVTRGNPVDDDEQVFERILREVIAQRSHLFAPLSVSLMDSCQPPVFVLHFCP